MVSRLCKANDTLLPGQTLSGSQTLVSKNGIYELSLFGGFMGSYDHYLASRIANSSNSLLWVANRGNPIQDHLMSELHISSTGNLVLTKSQELIQSTHLTRSNETTSTIAVLLDTGNLVLKVEDNISRMVWQSFDHPTDTWFQGAPLGFNAVTGKNVHLTLSDHYSGSIEFNLELDPSRARGFIIRQLSRNVTYHGIFPQLIDIGDHGIFPNKNHTFIQLYNWFVMMYWPNDPSNYTTLWSSPDTRCDFDSVCGPSSFCFAAGTYAGTMVPEIGIGIGIGLLTAESESDKSAGIGRIKSLTRIFLAEVLFCSKKIGKN
ncbi:S-locus-specific glycoprotein S13-like [Carex rostrata]